MLPILLKFFGGRAAKAVASGVGGAILNGGLMDVFVGGVVTGVEPQVNAAGMAVGAILGGGIQYLLTYIPRNKPDKVY